MTHHSDISHGARPGPLSTAATVVLGLALVAIGSGSVGCATKGYVRQQLSDAQVSNDTRMSAISDDVSEAQARADQAFAKATLAEQLASGALDYTVVSTQEMRFAFDDYRLDDAATGTLDAMVTSLASRPRGVIEIRGFADASGDERYNYRLGRERAEAVERYLVTRHGVAAARIAVLSMGEDEPTAGNDTEDGRAQNRRVAARLLEITPKPGDVPLAVAP